MGWERWRRVPEPGACDFCLMLATRGAVYASQSTAGKDNDYHAHCHCDQESEGNFDARTDVRISLSDARNEVEFYHERSGYSYSYDLSRFRNAGVTDVPGVPEWELGLQATAEEVALRSATIERKLTELLASEQTPWTRARIIRLVKEDDLLARRSVARPPKTTPTFRRGPLAEPKTPKMPKAAKPPTAPPPTREATQPWTWHAEPPQDVLAALNRAPSTVDDFHYISNGHDVVSVPKPRTMATKKARREVQEAERDLEFAQQELSYVERRIQERLDELATYADVSPRDLANYAKGHKVRGAADPLISKFLETAKPLRARVQVRQGFLDDARRTLDDAGAGLTDELSAADKALAERTADDLSDVTSRMPQWRRFNPDGTVRGYEVQFADQACDDIGALAYTYRGYHAVYVSRDAVRDVSPRTGGWHMRAGGTPAHRRTIAHEIGHTADNPGESATLTRVWDAVRADQTTWKAVSEYGRSEPAEAYAELFAEWMYGDRTNPAVRLFADAFQWDSGIADYTGPWRRH